jgi:hypothetical protein
MAQYNLTQLMSLTELSTKDNVFLSYTPPLPPDIINELSILSIFSLELINPNYKGPIVTIQLPEKIETVDLYYTTKTNSPCLPSGGDLTNNDIGDLTNTDIYLYLGNFIQNNYVTLVKWYDQSGNGHNMSSFIPENRPSISLDSRNSYLQVDFAPVYLNPNNKQATPTFLNVTDKAGGPIPSFASKDASYTVICQYNSIASGGGICAYGLNKNDDPFRPPTKSNTKSNNTVNNFILTTDNYFENSFNYDQIDSSAIVIDTKKFVGAEYTNDSKYSGQNNDYTQNNNSINNVENVDDTKNHIFENSRSYNPSNYNFIIFTYDGDGGNLYIYNVLTNDNDNTITVTPNATNKLVYQPNTNNTYYDFHLIGAYKNADTFNLIEDLNSNGQLYNLITFQKALTQSELKTYISELISTSKLQAPAPLKGKLQAPAPLVINDQ